MTEPGALLQRYGGDWRSVVAGPAAGLLQLMYPPLGSAVAEQSGFFADPTARIFRSVPQIWATILAADSDAQALRIRDLHVNIKGIDSNGHRYHALDPETFWWAHATFTWMIFRSFDFYRRDPLDDRQREQLYAETVRWYEQYGVSTRPVPPDYVAFRDAFDRFCAERLELTPAARRALNIAREGGDHRLPIGPAVVYKAGRPALNRLAQLASVGNLPASVRDQLGIRWNEIDQRRYARFAAALRIGFSVTPYPVNRRTFVLGMRTLGARTRRERNQPAA